jgi:hypothetical protein
MYLENKYTRWYDNIIDNAQRRTLHGYTESHHIIPKSLGGSNDKANIVRLTAREHFICHRLLTKMTVGADRKKMLHAIWAFNRTSKNQNRIKISSRTYETIRKEFANMLSETRTGKWNVGRVQTEDEKKRRSIASKGKPKSEETRLRMKEAWKTRQPRTEEHCKSISVALKGRIMSGETKQKMSDSHKGKTPVHTLVPFVCEHCGKKGTGIGNYKRWHGTNCSLRNV